MPSFCWPLGFGPKPAITRPFAGQRNFGSAPVRFRRLRRILGAGVVRRRRDDGWRSAAGSGSFGAAADGRRLAPDATAAGGALGLRSRAPRTPGITRRSPTLSVAVGWMLLALAISATGLL